MFSVSAEAFGLPPSH